MLVKYEGENRRVMNIGYERISEQEKRQEKVNQLKNKIRKEIKEIREQESFILKNSEKDNEQYKKSILTLTVLYAIEDYLKSSSSFMAYNAVYEKEDIIIYYIHIDTIDLLLQPTYNFVINFLIKLEDWNVEEDRYLEYYFVGDNLTDFFISHRMISIFDQLEHEKRLNGEKNENNS